MHHIDRHDRYPFTDDTCPPLESVVEFCENAKTWLDAHEENVVSLHCKAGKGKAWIMAACLMVRMGETAQEAVASYDAVRRQSWKRGNGGEGENRAVGWRELASTLLKWSEASPNNGHRVLGLEPFLC